MQHQIPQFIEVENKIVGPLSFRQFFILLIGVAFGVFFWYLDLTFSFFFLATGIVGALTVTVAFGKLNGRPAASYFGSMVRYLFQPTLFFWKTPGVRVKKTKITPSPVARQKEILSKPLTEHPERLKSLSQAFYDKKSSEQDPDTYLM